MTLVWSRKAVGESSREQRSYRELEQPTGTDFSQNSWPHIILKLTREPPGHASLPTHDLFFIGYGLHPRNACSPLVTAYIHALFYGSWVTPTHCLLSGSHFVDFIYSIDESVNYIHRVHRRSNNLLAESEISIIRSGNHTALSAEPLPHD